MHYILIGYTSRLTNNFNIISQFSKEITIINTNIYGNISKYTFPDYVNYLTMSELNDLNPIYKKLYNFSSTNYIHWINCDSVQVLPSSIKEIDNLTLDESTIILPKLDMKLSQHIQIDNRIRSESTLITEKDNISTCCWIANKKVLLDNIKNIDSLFEKDYNFNLNPIIKYINYSRTIKNQFSKLETINVNEYITVKNNNRNFIIKFNDKSTNKNNGHKSQFTQKIKTIQSKIQNKTFKYKTEKDIFNSYLKLLNNSKYTRYEKHKLLNEKISIIIPYKPIEDRIDLFNKCLNNLINLTKDDKDFEICIHEMHNKQTLDLEFIKDNNIKYMYTKWDDIFFKAYNMNLAAKYLGGKILCFFDADMIVDSIWLDELKEKRHIPSISWKYVYYLSPAATTKYIKENIIMDSLTAIAVNHEDNFKFIDSKYNYIGTKGLATGGIVTLSKSIFKSIGGFQESFNGTWGGTDNTFIAKLCAFGYNVLNQFDSSILHMYHYHLTKRNHETIQKARNIIINNTNEQWYDLIKNEKNKNGILNSDITTIY